MSNGAFRLVLSDNFPSCSPPPLSPSPPSFHRQPILSRSSCSSYNFCIAPSANPAMPFGSRPSRRGSRPLLVRWRHGAMSQAPTPLSSEKSSPGRKTMLLQASLQRVPMMTHIVVLILAIYGSSMFQYQVGFVYFVLHIVLVCSQLRTAYGMIRSVELFPSAVRPFPSPQMFPTKPPFVNWPKLTQL